MTLKNDKSFGYVLSEKQLLQNQVSCQALTEIKLFISTHLNISSELQKLMQK